MIPKYLQTALRRLLPGKSPAAAPRFQVVDGIVYDSGVPVLADPLPVNPPPPSVAAAVDAAASTSQIVAAPPPAEVVAELIPPFVDFLHSQNYSAVTVSAYSSDLRYWQKVAAAKEKSLFAFKHTDVLSAIATLKDNHARRRVCALRRFALNSQHEQADRLYRELCRVPTPAAPPRAVPADSADAQTIHETAKRLCSEGDRAGVWLGLLLFCGLRASEIHTVTLGSGFIRVWSHRGVARQVPCPVWLCSAMTTIKGNGRGGFKQSRRIVSRNLYRLGFRKLYRLRYSFAALLMAGGRSMSDVQALLGHSSIATTREYLNNEQGGLGDALELDGK